jgi:hypothetical protein
MLWDEARLISLLADRMPANPAARPGSASGLGGQRVFSSRLLRREGLNRRWRWAWCRCWLIMGNHCGADRLPMGSCNPLARYAWPSVWRRVAAFADEARAAATLFLG